MYAKLALRNIRRSLRDYIIYFITLSLTAALMYSFLALGFSPDIITMTENMSVLTSGILILSVLIAFMSSYDAGVAIDAPFTKASMDSVISFVDEHCGVQDYVTYYLYTVPNEPIEALSLSDYNHLRTILGLSTISMGSGKFLIHCDTWNYLDEIEQALEQQPEITVNGNSLTAMEMPVLTEPMEQYQMAGTNGYVLVLPDQVAQQLSGDKIRIVMKLASNEHPELKSELNSFLNSGEFLLSHTGSRYTNHQNEKHQKTRRVKRPLFAVENDIFPLCNRT